MFDICRSLAEGEPTAVNVRRMYELLQIAAARGCSGTGGTFGNLFAQIDFLCKRYGMNAADSYAIQTARRHGREGVTDREDWLLDLLAVASLISAVYDEDVPGNLRRLLPATVRSMERGLKVNKDCVRCIVKRFDTSTIWAESEEGEIVVDYGNTEQGRDFAYMRKILREGMQLNLLDCSVDSEGTVVPGLIVVEPDFMIDISSLAACFTGYGHHTLLYTLNRMKPKPNTQATLLGNFAGVALDVMAAKTPPKCTEEGRGGQGKAEEGRGSQGKAEEGRGRQGSLGGIMRRAFRQDALRYCACNDLNPEAFKREAMNQMKNIREAVEELELRGDSRSYREIAGDKGRYGEIAGGKGEYRELRGDMGSFLTEPSFVCERLGLQGRVDLMSADMALLVEQKSGKNMKIEHHSHDQHGLQLENHYVQLLLYYGILRYNFQKSDRQVDMRLLYSRYPASQGLVAVNYYRTLFREAIALRNKIVATELLIAREGFGRIIPHLNADVIYKDVVRDGYFHSYVLPYISDLNSQLSSLSPLERAYFERMMTFVYREQVCQKLGGGENAAKMHGGGDADLWQMPLGEKLETGNIFIGLTVVKCERTDDEGGYDLITLKGVKGRYQEVTGGSGRYEEIAGDSGRYGGVSNFRRGDMVYLYQYRDEPDVRESILYKGTLMDIGNGELTVILNDGQQDERVFLDSTPPGARSSRSQMGEHPSQSQTSLWAIEHGGSDVGTSGCIRGMLQFVTASPDRRALLLGQRVPRTDSGLQLSRQYNAHYDDILQRIFQARDYFLLVGPPGTGKTSMALRFIVSEELAQASKLQYQTSILLTAYTNRAVDEICAMLTDAGFDYLRIGNVASCDPRFAEHLISEMVSGDTDEETGVKERQRLTLSSLRDHIKQVPIIVSTTSMLLAQPFIFQLKHFSLAVVDEASQILEPGLVGLLSSEQIGRFVLIGDHKQLPAVVQQGAGDAQVDEACLRDIGLTDCRQSLFQRLYQWELSQGRTQFVGILDHQWRMHPDVAHFPSIQFYGGRLQPVPVAHQQAVSLDYAAASEDALDDLLKQHRVLFLPVDERSASPLGSSKEASERYDNPQANIAEARVVADLLRRIHRFYGERFDAMKTVGVIVPYRNQIAAIQTETARLGIPELMQVSVDTVERYQGSQRDVIIYSFTVSRLYQLDFLCASSCEADGQLVDRKLNVALTRARHQMLMVGNPAILGHNPLFRQLTELFSYS